MWRNRPNVEIHTVTSVSTCNTKPKYYDEDDEIMDKTKTSDYGSRAYDHLKSDSQSLHLKSSFSSRVPPSSSSSTNNSNEYGSRSNNDKDRDSPGRTLVSEPATTSKKDQSSDGNTSKDSKLCIRSYGDWDELASTTRNEPKTYFDNRVTKESQSNKPEKVIETEELTNRSSKMRRKYFSIKNQRLKALKKWRTSRNHPPKDVQTRISNLLLIKKGLNKNE